MFIELPCSAIEAQNYELVISLIEENRAVLDLNVISAKMCLRPIDVAAQKCNREMLKLLVSQGASLSRSQFHKDRKIENIVIQTALGESSARMDIYIGYRNLNNNYSCKMKGLNRNI